MRETNECACSTCKSACKHKPGWFKPGEAEKVAEHLGLTMQELFDQHLSVDWWQGSPNIFVLSPAPPGDEGDMFPESGKGICGFFKDGRCTIHAVKPFECKLNLHSKSALDGAHREVADSWDTPEHQQQIIDLYGDEPYVYEPSSLLGWW